MRIAVVLNPYSRKNRRAGVREAQLREVLGSAGEVYVTQSHAELTDVLGEVLTPKLSCLVSVGGDGALHWALNAVRPLAAARGMDLPMMLPTNGGTIDFVARRAGVEGRAESLLPRLMKALDRGPLEATEASTRSRCSSTTERRARCSASPWPRPASVSASSISTTRPTIPGP